MAKVLKHGNPRTHVGLRGRCSYCSCEFELEEGDIAVWREGGVERGGYPEAVAAPGAYYTRCPGCASEVRIVPPRNGGAALEQALAFVAATAAKRGRG
jgi:hypothetical protein